jgi:DDE family transposase
VVCAIDGTTMSAPDSKANLAEFTKHRCNNGGSCYPLLRLMVLVSCGTRTMIDAVFGPTSTGEVTYAYQLARSLRAGMILLLDRNFAAQKLISTLAATGADIMVRLKNSRVMPVLARYPDGSDRLAAQPGERAGQRFFAIGITACSRNRMERVLYDPGGRSRAWGAHGQPARPGGQVRRACPGG